MSIGPEEGFSRRRKFVLLAMGVVLAVSLVGLSVGRISFARGEPPTDKQFSDQAAALEARYAAMPSPKDPQEALDRADQYEEDFAQIGAGRSPGPNNPSLGEQDRHTPLWNVIHPIGCCAYPPGIHFEAKNAWEGEEGPSIVSVQAGSQSGQGAVLLSWGPDGPGESIEVFPAPRDCGPLRIVDVQDPQVFLESDDGKDFVFNALTKQFGASDDRSPSPSP